MLETLALLDVPDALAAAGEPQTAAQLAAAAGLHAPHLARLLRAAASAGFVTGARAAVRGGRCSLGNARDHTPT